LNRRCPKCGEVYAETAKFCDQEGEALIEVNSLPTPTRIRVRRRKWFIAVGAIAALFIAGLLAAPGLLRQYLRNNVEVVVETISLSHQAGAQQADKNAGVLSQLGDHIIGLVQATTGDQEVLTRIRVKNHTSLSGQLISAQYALILEDREIGRGNWTSTEHDSQVLRAGQDSPIEVPIRINAASAMNAVIDVIAGKGSQIKVRGEIVAAAFWGKFTVPFEVRLVHVDVMNDR
jgi:LEA14-like dessication related protein